ncbi:MAG: hypothetical protein M5U26_02505 [Planctomycetota bacterium]|nr:hypothetical protein [Planctomycetota bacterium]
MAFAAAYIITYSAVEVDSPSLVMIMSVDQAGAEGLPKVDFHRRMNDDVLVRPRLRDMLRDGLAVREDGRYRLTAKGRRSIRVFVLFRRLMRLSKGG